MLDDLISRLEATSGPDRNLDAMIHHWILQGKGTGYAADCPHYSNSIDAALALVERTMPGWVVSDLCQNSRHAGDPWGCELSIYYGSNPSKNLSAFSGYDFPSAPLAILDALLTAIIAQAEP